MDSITTTCNIYFCDYGAVLGLVDKNKTGQLLATLVLGKTCLHISQVRWTTKLSCVVKLCDEFWCQKLLQETHQEIR